ncbi:MAG: pirin family protein [Trueperella sp.]|nr:pirin family protein [Trueperella sp.]
MSNLEPKPEEHVCNGLRDGVTDVGDQGIQLLEPRVVPLGGPRAMTVYRTLPQRARSLVGAWCFVDSYGPDDVAQSGGMKVARHPHTGLATVSWLFEGRIDHIDSAGNWALVRPGEVNLMNAGTGISHSEYSTADTTTLHGIQLWYAFPDKYRFTEPSLDWYRPNEIFGDGWRAKVFLGDVLGERSPVKTYIPLTGAEIRLEAGASVEIDLNSEHEHAVQQISGAVYVNGSAVPDDNLAFVPLGATKVTLTAGEEPVIAIFIGGEPLGEQILMWWNFIGRTHEEIVTWRQAYQAEMGFDAPDETSPLVGRTFLDDDEALGSAISGPELDSMIAARYSDGRAFPQYGAFPPNQPDPLPAPKLPNARLKLRG